MKYFKKLFILSITLLSSVSTMAEIVDGVRQRPNVAKAEAFQTDVTYYLFNTKARMFFVGANDWNTRASVADHGYKVRFHDPQDDAPIPGVYELQDSVETKSGWYCTFSTSDGGAIWVDNNTETYRFWNIEQLTDEVFRISNQHLADYAEYAEAVAGKCLGWNGSDADTRLYFVDPNEEAVGADWVLVTEETYNAWVETWNGMKDQFNAAAELLTYINFAKEKSIDVSAEVTVYENEAATVDELNAAAASVQLKINNALAGEATVNNPSDMTGIIVNPAFDDGTATGWKGTAPNMVGDGQHAAANVAEHYNKTFDTYQELSSMPAGVYMLSNNGFLRGWWDDAVNHTNYTAYLYSIAGTDTFQVAMANPWEAKNTEPLSGYTEFGTYASEVDNYVYEDDNTYYAPNDPSAARLYFEKGYYENKVFFCVNESDVVLGVKKDVNKTNEWVVFDNFKLTYYGNAPEAYQYWVSQTPKTEYSNAAVSDQYLNAYNAAFSSTATNKAEAKAAMAAIQSASDSIAKNSQLWATLKKMYDDAKTMTATYQTLIAAGALGDYLDNGYYNDVEEEIIPFDILDAEEKTGDNDLSNEQLQTVINKITELMDAVSKEEKEGLKPGTDVTKFLTNPGFEDGSNGWTVVSKGGGNVQLGGNYDNHCYEAWHSTNFDVYQEVKDLPIGVYEISVNGYMRYLDGPTACFDQANDIPANVPIYVYMNDSKTNFVNWLSYPKPEEFYNEISGAAYLTDDVGFCYPDNMIAASAAFLDGGYLQSAKCLVAEEGAVTRVGVKGTPEAKFWPIFDNFKLTYLGMDIDVVKPLLREQMDIAYKKQYALCTRNAHEMINAALADAETSIQNADGEAMFAAIANLEKAINAVDDSKPVIEAYQVAITGLEESQNNSTNVQVFNEVSDFIYAQYQAIENFEIDEEMLEELYNQIALYRTKLLLPNYEEASADSPVDMTAVIVNPGFEEYGTNSINGWNVQGNYNFGNTYSQQEALALEFYGTSFDINQTISGLPEGWYQVRVNAFLRSEFDVTLNEYANLNAFLYADAGGDYSEKSIRLKNDSFVGFDINDMRSSVDAFAYGFYENRLDVYVGSDGTLTLGMLKRDYGYRDWVMLDNWQLIYTGNDWISDENPVDPDPIITSYSNLYVEYGTAFSKGKTNMLPISLSNDQEILGVQFDVVLPKGMTFVQRGSRLNANRIYDHALSSNVLEDGSVRMIVTSLSNAPIYDYDGVLVNLALSIPSDMPVGDYAVTLKNIVLTNIDKETIYCPDMTSYVRVVGRWGDVNNDDEINITDVVMMIENILYRYPQGFNEMMADVNGDGWIDVADVVSVIDVILGRTVISRSAAATDYVGQLGIQRQLNIAGETTAVPVSLTNLTTYSAFQMDVTLPAGLSLEKVAFTERAAKSHQLTYSKIADGKYRIVGFSLQNEGFNGESGDLLQLSVKSDGSSFESGMHIDEIKFVTPQGTAHNLMAVDALGEITGIATLKANGEKSKKVYDLQGRRIEKAAKGVLIIDGKKNIKK